jgi:serine protease AprX
MDSGDGRPQTYLECLEFFLAPFDLQRRNANPSIRPAAIGNSYGCPR